MSPTAAPKVKTGFSAARKLVESLSPLTDSGSDQTTALGGRQGVPPKLSRNVTALGLVSLCMGMSSAMIHDPHRGPLLRARQASDPDGYRMGEGWRRWQALHRPGPPRNCGLATCSWRVRDLLAQGHWRRPNARGTTPSG